MARHCVEGHIGGASELSRVGLVGRSSAFRKMIDELRRFAVVDAPVLLYGQTGTGKELAARAIHYMSVRQGAPFVPIDCGALPETLFEGELFGHARGAYTDARRDMRGLIAQAEKGTVLIDEIHTLSNRSQAALLRFLQDRVYRPLGGERSFVADVRVIAATNKSLVEGVDCGWFRQDLYYRLNVASIDLPCLRERPDDISMLVQMFLEKFSRRYGVPEKKLDPGALSWLEQQPWPGNVRELENLIHREFVRTDGEVLTFEALASHLPRREGFPEQSAAFGAARAEVIARFERSYIRSMLASTGGNVSEAARRAGKERRVFGRMMKRNNIKSADFQ